MLQAVNFVGGSQGSRLSEMAATGEEKACCVLQYARIHSIVAVKRSFRIRFGNGSPMRKSIKQWYEKFQRDCCCASQNAKEKKVQIVRGAFH
jgi:hypothetical protein